MSWYYVGPDAKPVGPISLEELQARRSSGAIGQDTYVIEAPAGSAPKEWRRFRDVFPPAPTLPPLPAAASASPAPASPTMGVPHPIFPVTPPAVPSPGGPVFTGSHPSTYHLPPSRTNGWCSWGFGLGLASLLGLVFCGTGALLIIPGLVVSVIGLIQVSQHREQHGRSLAVTGIILSLLSLFCVVAFIVWIAISGHWNSSLQMTTEQTSNDSDTR
jgi:hypothetical protein